MNPITAVAPLPEDVRQLTAHDLSTYLLASAAFLLARGSAQATAGRADDHSMTAGIHAATAAYALAAHRRTAPSSANTVARELAEMRLDGSDLNEAVVNGLAAAGIDAEALFAAGQASVSEEVTAVGDDD